MTEALASAFWHLTQEGAAAPPDILVLLEHRLRDVLIDGDCPSCAAIQLAKKLDEAIDAQT